MTMEELIHAGAGAQADDQAHDQVSDQPTLPPAPETPERRGLWRMVPDGWLKKLLQTPAKQTDLAEYASHTLNPRPGSEGGARIARGLDAMFDGLSLAVVDILWGLVQLQARGAK